MIDLMMNHCPVCGMPLIEERHIVEYHHMRFNFCSEQCRERFNAQPSLYSSGVIEGREPLLKHRKLCLAIGMDGDTSRAIAACLGAVMGVREVEIKEGCVQITYDLWQVTQAHIEKALSEKNIRLDDSPLQRLRRAWARNLEDNELENLAHAPSACCNRPPPGA